MKTNHEGLSQQCMQVTSRPGGNLEERGPTARITVQSQQKGGEEQNTTQNDMTLFNAAQLHSYP